MKQELFAAAELFFDEKRLAVLSKNLLTKRKCRRLALRNFKR